MPHLLRKMLAAIYSCTPTPQCKLTENVLQDLLRTAATYDEARLYDHLVSGPPKTHIPSAAVAAAQLEAARGRQRALQAVVDALMVEAALALQPEINAVVVDSIDEEPL